MAHSKIYRNFIILQQNEKVKLQSNDKALSGYAKVEAKADKCKISFYAQNLKKENKYLVSLILKKDMKQVLDLGELKVSDIGKGEITKEYYVDNVGGVNIAFDKIIGAAIFMVSEDKPRFIMFGFMSGVSIPEGWEKFKITKCEKKLEKEIKKLEKKQEKEEKKQEKEEMKQEKEEMKQEKEEMKDVDKKKEECHDDKEHNEHDHHKDEEHKEHEDKCCECKGSCQDRIDFDDYENNIEISGEIDPDNFKLRGGIGEYFESIVDGFEVYRDKKKDVKYCKWYKISVNDLDDMCNISNYNKYTVAYYPMINYYPYIKKYGYFMLGYKCDSKGNIKYIVYGVPGTKDRDEQPFAGKTGFVTWMKLNDEDQIGCWIMFYDFKNSTVVIPMQ